jgi:hypothetical protein
VDYEKVTKIEPLPAQARLGEETAGGKNVGETGGRPSRIDTTFGLALTITPGGPLIVPTPQP